MRQPKLCMIVPDPRVRGGIAALVNGYRNSQLEKDFKIIYVESYKDGNKLTKLFKGICGLLHFTKVLLIEKPDLVHIHSSFGPSFYRKLPFIYMACWAKKPIINHIHGAEFESFYMNASHQKKRLVEKVYGKCTVLIALSDEWKEKLKYIVSEEHITVIENYSIIHHDAVNDKKKRNTNNQVLFLGEIGQRKGCYDIPLVVKQVASAIPDVKFVLGGSGDIEKIMELFRRNGVEQHIIFPGWVRNTEKDKLLRSSDIFFLPSYNEGMPMSILDAMGYGLPIVSTYVGGIPKIVLNGENGYIFEPGDIDGFTRGIIELLKSSELLRSFGSRGYQIVCDRFSLEKHMSKLEDLYMKFL